MKKYPIIVGGFYRSGTSLLRRIIDAHRNINCPSEIKFFKDFYGQYKDDDLAHVRFFSTARSMGIDEKELLVLLGMNFVKLHELSAQRRGKQRWADKNPENLLYLEQWKTLLNGQMLFVFVVRNPLDCMSSLQEIGFVKDMPEEFWKKVDQFKLFTDKGIDFLQKNKKISYIMRYEDLVLDPENELKKLFHFIGEQYQPSVIDDFNSEERIGGIEDPKVKKTKEIHTASVGRWKRDLKTFQVNCVMEKCAFFAQKFGYSL